MGRSRRGGVRLVMSMSLAVGLGIYAASQGQGWPLQTWLCVGFWMLLGVVIIIVRSR